MKIESDSKWPTPDIILKYFRGIMSVVYILLGIVTLLKSDHLFRIPSSYSIPFGIILIAYGLIRGYQTYQRTL